MIKRFFYWLLGTPKKEEIKINGVEDKIGEFRTVLKKDKDCLRNKREVKQKPVDDKIAELRMTLKEHENYYKDLKKKKSI